MKILDCSISSLVEYFARIVNPHVVISSNHSPYFNLALESLLFENKKIVENGCVYIWRNTPSVVIGRFQNPWEEVSLQSAKRLNVDVCRRYSGGGTVYHDLGNVNFTFYSTFDKLKRLADMQMLANFLKARYSLGVETSTRHDLWLHSSKVSGSSARIVKDKAYHHCTLLCSAEITSMRQVLASCFVPLTSNSTKSVRSNVKNLFDTFDTNDFITLLDNFIVYLKGFGFSEDVIQIFDDSALCLKEETDKLASWDWVYGQTPEFSTLLPFYDPFCSLEMKINKGVVTSVSPPDEESVEVVQFSRKVESKLKNSRFDFDLLTKVLTLPEFNQ